MPITLDSRIASNEPEIYFNHRDEILDSSDMESKQTQHFVSTESETIFSTETVPPLFANQGSWQPNQYWTGSTLPNQVAGISFVTTKTQDTTEKAAVFHIDPSELESITIEKFRQTIMDKPYSSEAKLWGVPLLKQSVWLGWEGNSRVLFQVTGGNSLVAPRMCMVALNVNRTLSTANKIRIDWHLINNYDEKSRDFTGAWGQELDNRGITYPSNAIRTPFNEGYWELDRDAGTITYSLTSDPGGSLIFNPNQAFLIYPNFVVNEILGLTGSFTQTK